MECKRLSTYIAMALVFFLGAIEYAVILPTLYLYLQTAFHAEQYFIGLVLSAFSLMGMFSSPILGSLSDRTHKNKLILMFAVLFEVAGNIMYFVGISRWMVLASRLTAGISSGGEAVIIAELSRSSTEKQRTGLLSLFIALRQSGILIGPAFNFFLRLFDFYIGPFHINAYTAPGMFMTCLWIAMEFVLLFLYHGLPPIYETETESNSENERRPKTSPSYDENFVSDPSNTISQTNDSVSQNQNYNTNKNTSKTDSRETDYLVASKDFNPVTIYGSIEKSAHRSTDRGYAVQNGRHGEQNSEQIGKNSAHSPISGHSPTSSHSSCHSINSGNIERQLDNVMLHPHDIPPDMTRSDYSLSESFKDCRENFGSLTKSGKGYTDTGSENKLKSNHGAVGGLENQSKYGLIGGHDDLQYLYEEKTSNQIEKQSKYRLQNEEINVKVDDETQKGESENPHEVKNSHDEKSAPFKIPELPQTRHPYEESIVSSATEGSFYSFSSHTDRSSICSDDIVNSYDKNNYRDNNHDGGANILNQNSYTGDNNREQNNFHVNGDVNGINQNGDRNRFQESISGNNDANVLIKNGFMDNIDKNDDQPNGFDTNCDGNAVRKNRNMDCKNGRQNNDDFNNEKDTSTIQGYTSSDSMENQGREPRRTTENQGREPRRTTENQERDIKQENYNVNYASAPVRDLPPTHHPSPPTHDPLPPTHDPNCGEPTVEVKQGRWQFYCDAFVREELVVLIAIQFIVIFNQIALETMVTPLTYKIFGWGEVGNSILYSCAAALVICVFLLVRVLSKRFQDRSMILFGLIVLVVVTAFFTWGIPDCKNRGYTINLVRFAFGVVFDMISFPFIFVCSIALFSKKVDQKLQGLGQGVRRSVVGFAAILAPLWAGSTVSQPYLMFGVMASLNVLALILMLLSYKCLYVKPETDSNITNGQTDATDGEREPLLAGNKNGGHTQAVVS